MFRKFSGFAIVASLLLAVIATPFMGSTARGIAQGDAPISCAPTPGSVAASPAADAATPAEPVAPAEDDLLKVTMGYVPASVFAPVFVAKEKGYFAAAGLDVTLEPLPGGSDMVALTASGDFDLGIGGVGPAFWNAMALGMPLTVIAPGHQEGSPVATPLMVSVKNCESGAITKVSDLKGKKVSVNARGATEFWLATALATGRLTLDDIDLQTLPFPDAIAALESGAVDAAMIGEPLATKAEADGIAVRLAPDFPVQGVQPTMIFANNDWLAENPEAASGLIGAYLQAATDLTDNFNDPANLAIIEQYTKVPAALVAASVKPVYAIDGQINVESLQQLQAFFRERGLLEYDTDIDPATIIDTQYVDAAVTQP